MLRQGKSRRTAQILFSGSTIIRFRNGVLADVEWHFLVSACYHLGVRILGRGYRCAQPTRGFPQAR